MGRQWIGLIVLLAVAVSSIPPAAVAVAQVQTSTPVSSATRVKEFIEAVSSVIGRMKEMGVNVSKAEELLKQAREALDSGDLGRARSLALLALIAAGSKARELAGAPRPVAAGLLMEIATLKRIAMGLNATDLVSKLERAEELLSKGLVNETTKLLKEVREAIRRIQAELCESIRLRARAEAEAEVRARIREEKIVSELVKELRKAGNLSDIGKTLKAVRALEKLRERFNATIEGLDRALANVSEQSLALLRSELGKDLEELLKDLGELKATFPLPLGLIKDIELKIVFVERLKEKLPSELKDLSDDLVLSLKKLRESASKMIKCEEGYEEPLREARELAQRVLSNLAASLPLRGSAAPPKGWTLPWAIQLYAIAKWVLTMVDVLPKIIVCPAIGSEVVFRGVVLSVGEQVLAFGVVRTTGLVAVEPVGSGELGVPYLKRVAVRIGIFALDLSKLEREVSLSVGDVVSCLGVYLGYVDQSKYPVIEVHQIEKLFRVEEIVLED